MTTFLVWAVALSVVSALILWLAFKVSHSCNPPFDCEDCKLACPYRSQTK